MAVKIRVKDFQSLGDVEMVIDGLTVVTGSNNTGKTALMRALRAAFSNAKGTSFIRHGAAKTSVEIDFGDGHTLYWTKGKGKADKPTYIVDGGKPIHPGQGVPDEVRALGVLPVMAGGREIWPQIAPQFQQIFLLDQPGSVMAEAVADVERVGQLNDALRLAASDQRSAVGELTTRRTDLIVLNKQLERFAGLDALIAETQEIEVKSALVLRVETALSGIKALRDRRASAMTLVDFLAPITAVELPAAADGDALRDLVTERDALVALRARLTAARERVASLSGVGSVEVPPAAVGEGLREQATTLSDFKVLRARLVGARTRADSLAGVADVKVPASDEGDSQRTLAEDIRSLSGLKSRLDVARAQVQALGGVSGVEIPDAFPSIADMQQELSDLRLLSKRHAKAKGQVEWLQRADFPEPLDTTKADKILTALGMTQDLRTKRLEAEKKVGAAKTDVETAQSEYEVVDAELTAALQGLTQCPVCNSPLHEAHK